MTTKLFAILSSLSLLYSQPGQVINSAVSTAPIAKEMEPIVRMIDDIRITAYSSTADQTDDTPFLTASQTEVRDGIVATNMFPFGTKIKIPELFGDKVFVVEDRMHRRKTNFVDVWMPTTSAARQFGINTASIVVLD